MSIFRTEQGLEEKFDSSGIPRSLWLVCVEYWSRTNTGEMSMAKRLCFQSGAVHAPLFPEDVGFV